MIGDGLPATIAGYPTRFVASPLEAGTPVLVDAGTTGPTSHGVTSGTLSGFLTARFGITSTTNLDVASWLTITEQHLLEVVRGGVWHDDPGDLTRTRADLAWYPDDIWRYRLTAGWKRIAQHEAFIGRTGEIGDTLGSHLITLASVRDIMHLAFLIERQYAPYEKWLGHAFAELEIASSLRPLLDRARYGDDWRTRETGIVDAVTVLAHAQNALDACAPVDPHHVCTSTVPSP